MIDIKPTLDTAWIEAEQRLGEWWRIRSLVEIPGGWEAVATDGHRIVRGLGHSPLHAIRMIRPADLAPDHSPTLNVDGVCCDEHEAILCGCGNFGDHVSNVDCTRDPNP